MQKLILLTDLILDAGTQVRVEINKEAVEDYAEAYRSKSKMPPIDVFYDGGKYIVVDGFHRAMGATQAGEKHIRAEVHTGNRDKALLFSLGANNAHGLRRTNADKRNAVFIAVHKWPRKNNSEIAEMCAVSRHLVDNIRPAKETTPADLDSPRELLTESGKVNEPTYESPKSKDAEVPPSPSPAPAPVATTAPAPAPAPAPVQAELNGDCDDMGYPLPKGMVFELFQQRGELEELVGYLQKVKNAVKKVMDCGGSPLYRHLNLSSVLPDLEVLISTFKGAVPYAVCPYCQGLNLEQCTNCRHTGFVGRFMFERQIPIEHQQMRKLHIEQLKAKKKK